MYDINTEEAVRKHRYYYHVTPKDNIDQIKKTGLKANEEGHIFVFTNIMIAEDIAFNQCGLEEVALFMIDSRGITGKVIKDRVGEFTAAYHRIIIQDKISKRYVRFSSSWTIDLDNPSPWDIYKSKILYGMNKKQAIKFFHELKQK